MRKGHLGEFAVFFFVILLIASCSFQRTDLHELAKSGSEITVFADYLALPDGSGVYSFGRMGVFDTLETWFTIQNNGNITSTILSVRLSDGDVSQFEIDTSSTMFTLAPGESTGFSIRFLPTEGGDKFATVSIEVQGGDTYTFTVNGHGAVAKIIVMQDSTMIQNGGTGYNFGSHGIGLPFEATFIVQNQGDFDLRITGLLLSNSDAAQFDLESDTLNSIVRPGQTTTFRIKFKPTKLGNVTTKLVLICNDPENTEYVFPLYGDGQSSGAILPDIKVYLGPTFVPDKGVGYHFGTVQVDESSNPITFTITNEGGAGALDLSIHDIDFLEGGDIDDFSVDTSMTAEYVREGESTTFDVLFEPMSAGAKQATISISSDDPDMESYTFTVTGTGTAIPQPDIHVKVKDTGEDLVSGNGKYNFGNVYHIGDSSTEGFTIANNGSANLILSPPISFNPSLPEFSSTSPSLTTIKPGNSAYFEITFDPTTDIFYETQVEIYCNDPDENPYKFTVRGTGNTNPVADIAVRQGSIYIPHKSGSYNFGSVVKDTSKAVTFTIENKGSANLDVTSITSDDTQFVPSISTITVPGGTTGTFDITFTPPSTKNQKAKITLDNTDPDTNPFTFTVKGTGTKTEEPDIAWWADGRGEKNEYKDFEKTIEGETSPPVTFTIENKGQADLEISSIILTKGEKDFKIDLQETSFLIRPNESTTFDIIFTPDKNGKRKGTLEIRSNDPDTDKLKISLEGKGLDD